MMSKKTKAMEQQLTQLAQENDALRAQLAAAGVEIENVKSELAKTVGERDRFMMVISLIVATLILVFRTQLLRLLFGKDEADVMVYKRGKLYSP